MNTEFWPRGLVSADVALVDCHVSGAWRTRYSVVGLLPPVRAQVRVKVRVKVRVRVRVTVTVTVTVRVRGLGLGLRLGSRLGG